jgi:hypothetical protein
MAWAEESAQEFLECVPWAASVCLTTVREDRKGSVPTTKAAQVKPAAELLFTLVQNSLALMRDFGYGQEAERSLLGLSWVQSLAVEAVAAICPGSRLTAKLLQLQVAAPEPLTVCVGDLKPTRLPDLRDELDPLGELEEHKIPTLAWNSKGSGCGSIFADCTGTRRPSFSGLCKQCRGSGTARREAYVTALRHAFVEGSPSGTVWIDGRRVRVWPRRCSVCARPFMTDRANRYCCELCQPSHRSRRPV